MSNQTEYIRELRVAISDCISVKVTSMLITQGVVAASPTTRAFILEDCDEAERKLEEAFKKVLP